ncbi:MAG: helix-turn-helix domain-containing protein [Victivallaceae bacterium]|jgi:hypothetical protein
MAVHYLVTLNADERTALEEITKTGVRAAKTVLYARALLLLDRNADSVKRWTVASVGEALGMTARTLEHLKERFVKYGLDAALERKKPVRPSRKLIFTGEFAARLTQLACSEAPKGRSRWTVRLLAEKLVELQIVPAVSAMTVCNTLKKMNFVLTSANTGKFHRTKMRSL